MNDESRKFTKTFNDFLRATFCSRLVCNHCATAISLYKQLGSMVTCDNCMKNYVIRPINRNKKPQKISVLHSFILVVLYLVCYSIPTLLKDSIGLWSILVSVAVMFGGYYVLWMLTDYNSSISSKMIAINQRTYARLQQKRKRQIKQALKYIALSFLCLYILYWIVAIGLQYTPHKQ